MIVKLTPTLHVWSASGGRNKPRVVLFRSATPIPLIGNDGEEAVSEQLESGLYQVKLSARQSVAFNALSLEEITAAQAAGQIVLPDSHKGRTAVLGVPFGTFIQSRAAAEDAAEDASQAPEDGSQAPDAPEADTEAPAAPEAPQAGAKGSGKGSK